MPPKCATAKSTSPQALQPSIDTNPSPHPYPATPLASSIELCMCASMWPPPTPSPPLPCIGTINCTTKYNLFLVVAGDPCILYVPNAPWKPLSPLSPHHPWPPWLFMRFPPCIFPPPAVVFHSLSYYVFDTIFMRFKIVFEMLCDIWLCF